MSEPDTRPELLQEFFQAYSQCKQWEAQIGKDMTLGWEAIYGQFELEQI